MLLLTVPGKLKLLLCLIYSWPDILETLWIERIIDFNAKAPKRTVDMKTTTADYTLTEEKIVLALALVGARSN